MPLLLLMAIVAAVGCAPEPSRSTPRSAPAPVPVAGKVEPDDEAPNIAATPFRLTDQNGDEFDSKSLAGKVWMGAIFFANCPGPCFRENQAVAEILREIDDPDFMVVSLTCDPDNEEAEFAVTVRSELKGGGLGTLLMGALIDHLRQRGTRRLVAYVLRDNDRMLQLARDLGMQPDVRHPDPETVKVAMDLQAEGALGLQVHRHLHGLGVGVTDVGLHPQVARELQHAVVVAQHVGHEPARAALAQVVDQRAHQQRAQAAALELGSHGDREFRLLVVGVAGEAHDHEVGIVDLPEDLGDGLVLPEAGPGAVGEEDRPHPHLAGERLRIELVAVLVGEPERRGRDVRRLVVGLDLTRDRHGRRSGPWRRP